MPDTHAVTRDQLAGLEHVTARRPRDDGFGRAARGHHDEIGLRTHPYAFPLYGGRTGWG